jgi:hypothetical protein
MYFYQRVLAMAKCYNYNATIARKDRYYKICSARLGAGNH